MKFHSRMVPKLKRPRPMQHQRAQGVSLIEVLVAILLVALGILAMGAMQLNASRIAKGSEFQAMGALLAADLADRMRANPAGVLDRVTKDDVPVNRYAFEDAYPLDGDVDPDKPGITCDTVDATCTPGQMAAYDMYLWRQTVAATLPGGWARVSSVDISKTDTGLAENAVDVWLMWVDAENNPSVMAADNSACPADAVQKVPDDKKDAVKVPVPHCMYFRVNL